MGYIIEQNNSIATGMVKQTEIGVLNDKTRWNILTELAKQPNTAKNLSEKLGLDEQLTCYHIRKLEKANLVKVIRREAIRGATAKHYTACFPALSIVLNNEWKIYSEKNEPPDILKNFVKDGKVNCKIIIGSPDYHGPERQRARDSFYGIDFALLLGTYCSTIENVTLMDVEANQYLKNNLVCIGGPIANLITSKVMKNSLIHFKGRSITSSLSKKSYDEPNVGIVVRTKNPFSKEHEVLILAGKSRQGTLASVLCLTRNPFMDYHNNYNKKETAKVVEGIDIDGDGIIDEVEVLE